MVNILQNITIDYPCYVVNIGIPIVEEDGHKLVLFLPW